jgi:acyl carrier protein
MSDPQTIRDQVYQAIQALIEDDAIIVGDDTPLIGDGSALDSMRLVELCLSLEDKAAELDFEFDWTSEAAMSKSRSMFKTAGTLAAEFVAQMDALK